MRERYVDHRITRVLAFERVRGEVVSVLVDGLRSRACACKTCGRPAKRLEWDGTCVECWEAAEEWRLRVDPRPPEVLRFEAGALRLSGPLNSRELARALSAHREAMPPLGYARTPVGVESEGPPYVASVDRLALARALSPGGRRRTKTSREDESGRC